MQMRPNLNFAGYAADVLSYYQAALGGETEITRFAGSIPEQHIPPARLGRQNPVCAIADTVR
jgi:uncharacterized glyoxalase superfamily protein PhnB